MISLLYHHQARPTYPSLHRAFYSHPSRSCCFETATTAAGRDQRRMSCDSRLSERPWYGSAVAGRNSLESHHRLRCCEIATRGPGVQTRRNLHFQSSDRGNSYSLFCVLVDGWGELALQMQCMWPTSCVSRWSFMWYPCRYHMHGSRCHHLHIYF